MKLPKRIVAMTGQHKKTLRTVLPGLRELRETLAECRQSMDPLGDIVVFFGATSKWHDRGIRDVIAAYEAANHNGRYDATLEKLRILEKHFVNAGRDEYGFNRTKPGEPVAATNVWLGDCDGVWTKTVHYWRGRDENGTKHPATGLTAKETVTNQAAGFMRSHSLPMIKIINYLESVVAA